MGITYRHDLIRDGFVYIRGFAPGNHSLTSLCNAKKALDGVGTCQLSCLYLLQLYIPCKNEISMPSKPDTSSTNQSPSFTHVHPVVSAGLVFDKQGRLTQAK